MSQRATIENNLARMQGLNDVAETDLRGGAYCAEFFVRPGAEPWVQAKTGVINIQYHGGDDPIATLRASGVELPPSAKCADFEPGKFATVEFDRLEPAQFAELIDQIFVKFYGCGSDYKLSTNMFDVR